MAVPAHVDLHGRDSDKAVVTPDRRVRVFVSSTLAELADERRSVRDAIHGMHLTPVMFELGARSHPPRAVYRSYLEQSDVFVGIYAKRYGWVAPGETVSGLEDEYRLSAGMPRLLYVKRIDERDEQLTSLLAHIQADDAASYRLFDDADELATLVADDLAVLLTERFTAQRARPDDVSSHNLPARVTTMVGRDRDVTEVLAAVRESRLVTITGAGGTGKTRLAVEVAWQMVGNDVVGDGVWFVDLSGADAQHVAAALAQALRLPVGDSSAEESRLARLAQQLQSDRRLIVLDNCEHVVDAVAELVDALLSGCPDVRILATSREALALAGEVQYALAPLATEDAVELFVQRARAVRHSFHPDAATLELIRDLCAQLDGLPLAVELAAARVKTLTVPQIVERLGDRFKLLTGGTRTAAARQQTLRATVDWSYRLLSDPERALLRRVSVFRAAWDLTAAECVATDRTLAAEQVLDVLERLVDRSLVTVGGGRFRLSETVRTFAAEKLADAGEADEVMMRNVARLIAFASDRDAKLRGPGHGSAKRDLVESIADVRAALNWCAETGHTEAGQQLAAAMGWFWFLGDHDEGRRFLHRLLDAGQGSPASRGRALQAIAIVDRPAACVVHPQPACADAARASIPLLEAAADARSAALSRVLLAVEGVRGQDVDDALALLAEATSTLAGDRWAQALADFIRMELGVRVGDIDAALAHGDDAADAFREIGDVWGVSAVRSHQGENLRVVGRLDKAVAAFDEALAIARPAGLFNTVQLVAGELGIVRIMVGDDVAALRDLDEAREVSRRYAFGGGEGLYHVGYGHLARRRGDMAAARAHFDAAVAVLDTIRSVTYVAAASSARGFLLEQLGEADAAEEAHRHVLDAAARVREPYVTALGLEGLAGVAHKRGDSDAAAQLLGAADTLRLRSKRPRDPIITDDVNRIATAARAAMGVRAFEAARMRGGHDSAISQRYGIENPTPVPGSHAAGTKAT